MTRAVPSFPTTRLTRRHLLALLGALAATGCAGRTESARPNPSTTATLPSTAPRASASPPVPRPATATRPASPLAGTPASRSFQVETLITGLEVPWELAFAPDGRAFLTERPGRVRALVAGRLLPEPVAVIADVAASGEGGLLGLALDPAFAQNHHFYVYYTYRDNGAVRNRVARYTEADNRASDSQVLLDGIPGAGIHDGGRLAFGPDGKLYVTTGDAADSALAQRRDSLAGKILRLNPDGSVPADNPFPGSPVYSYGHRNPQGLAWQPGAGRLYATEHGPSAHDEVNQIVAGANYGWPAMQGNSGPRDGFTPPVIESGADTTWAPSGATFVRAATFPQWQGSLLFAALRGATLWQLTLPGEGAPPQLTALVRQQYGRLRDVVEGPDGLLYILTNNRDGRGSPQPSDDRILRLVPG